MVSTICDQMTGILHPHTVHSERYQELLSPVYNQFGHSVDTHMKSYGPTSNTFRGITAYQLGAFHDTSVEWQTFLTETGSDSTDCIPVEPDESLAIITEKPITPASSEKPIAMSSSYSGRPAGDFMGDCSNYISIHLPRDIVAQAISLLQKVFPPSATCILPRFKSKEQLSLAVDCIQAPSMKCSILFALKTGSGKTLGMILALLHELEVRTIISPIIAVIVPLVALGYDLESRLKSIGVDAQFWRTSSELRSRCQAIILTPELASSIEGRKVLNSLTANGRLKTIFIDEGHIFLTSLVYRPQIANFLSFIRELSLSTVFLSGTCPPRMFKLLKLHSGMTDMVCKRSDVLRKNICWLR